MFSFRVRHFCNKYQLNELYKYTVAQYTIHRLQRLSLCQFIRHITQFKLMYTFPHYVRPSEVDRFVESGQGSFLEGFRQSWVGMACSGDVFSRGTIF